MIALVVIAILLVSYGIVVLDRPPVQPAQHGQPTMKRLPGELYARFKRSPVSASLRGRTGLLAGVALAVYALTRLIGLERFPIYFFTDEAIQSVLAETLLANDLRDHNGVLLPTYFLNFDKYNLGLSIYIHALSVKLFGTTVLVNRATSVVVSFVAAIALLVLLKRVFGVRLWWLGPLALAATPTWFLHSRTGFELVMAVSFYAGFLATYLLYRYSNPRYMLLAILFAAASFYSYAAGQGLMLASAILLLLSDLLYHLRQIRRHPLLALAALALMAVMAGPYLRFRALHPEALEFHLNQVGSYWVDPLPLSEKLSLLGQNYLVGLDPRFWFEPDYPDIVRHVMKGMGRVSLLVAPFILLGLLVCLWRWRSSAHRAVLIAMVASIFPAAISGMGITRTQSMVIPLALLLVLGLEQLARWLRHPLAYRLVALLSGAGLTIFSFWMLATALRDGPTWYDNYSMYGMQWGAPQIFGQIQQVLEQSPETEFMMSPNWSNNPVVFVPFFLDPPYDKRVRVSDSIHGYLFSYKEIKPNTLFIFPTEEYAHALAEPDKLQVEPPSFVVNYPDGKPGFYGVHMRYTEQAQAIFERERVERRTRLDERQVLLDGQDVSVRYSLTSGGEAMHIFDQDFDTLMRGEEANPFVIELRFPAPRRVSELDLTVGSMQFELELTGQLPDGSAIPVTKQTYTGLPDDPKVTLALQGGPHELSLLRLSITQLHVGEPAAIHVRELLLR